MRGSNVVLYSDEVVLRPWQIEDARWYVESRDEEVFRWTTENRTLTVRETEEAIQQIKGRDDVFTFAIVDPETDELLGNIALVLEANNPRSGEVMYWLAGRGRGRGLATQAVKVLCRWAFDPLSAHPARIILRISRSTSHIGL
jgi:RimJ/RimL family protein N-acetyltransferase